MAQASRELPDWFGPVAEDVLQYCRPERGLWVDLGCGAGGLGLALARSSDSTVVLIDPNSGALTEAVEKARGFCLVRVVPIVASAEDIPLPDGSADLAVSRGSIFFWDDPPEGLREVHRILRPDCRAMIGGGFGSSYPEWAHKEFFRRRYDSLKAQGEEAVRKWEEPRRMEWLVEQAARALLRSCGASGGAVLRSLGGGGRAGVERALVEPVPPGRWLLLVKSK